MTANVENRAGKSAYNSEVFGRVRYKRTGESALYGAVIHRCSALPPPSPSLFDHLSPWGHVSFSGDFAEATDAGKLTDIPDEIKPGQSKVTFLVKLDKAYNEDEALDFVSLKARTYPGAQLPLILRVYKKAEQKREAGAKERERELREGQGEGEGEGGGRGKGRGRGRRGPLITLSGKGSFNLS